MVTRGSFFMRGREISSNRYDANIELLKSKEVDKKNFVIRLVGAIGSEKELSFSDWEKSKVPDDSIYKHRGYDFDFFIDIDDTICENSESTEYRCIVEILDRKHYIYNGLEEFLLFLLKIEGSRIIFYSAGNPQRNDLLISKLIEIFRLTMFSTRILVYSELLLTTMFDQYRPDPLLIRNGDGYKKKKIATIARDINNSILIDDDRSYCIKGEEFNFLRARGETTSKFNGLSYAAGLIYLFLSQNDFNLVQFMQLIYANCELSGPYTEIGETILSNFTQTPNN